MKKYSAMKASCELCRDKYLKKGGYYDFIAVENDTEQEELAVFESLSKAIDYLKSKYKYSTITPYPSNGLVNIEEYYVAECSIDEDREPCCDWVYVLPLDTDSKRYVHDIYFECEGEE